jgi:thiol-disulfide isomerase/thioredoxin
LRAGFFSTLILLLPLGLSSLGCQREQGKGEKPRASRVVSVKAPTENDSFAEFCDVVKPRGTGAIFRLPELDTAFTPPGDQPRWINFWATWCKPCIAEMPMLVEWKSRLAKEQIQFSLEFVSVDETASVVQELRQKHPSLPASLRLKDPDLLEGLMRQMGLDKGAGLPIHLFLGTSGQIHCVRAAAVSESHYATIRKLLR